MVDRKFSGQRDDNNEYELARDLALVLGYPVNKQFQYLEYSGDIYGIQQSANNLLGDNE